MVTTKVTFTLDNATLAHLADAADRLARPKSQIVRQAIEDYHQNLGRLNPTEKLRMLQAFDELIGQIPVRSAAETKRELEELRKARRTGGRPDAGLKPSRRTSRTPE